MECILLLLSMSVNKIVIKVIDINYKEMVGWRA